MLGEERLGEARHGLRAGHVRPRDEPAQAPPADLGAGEQHEVRAADPLADPAEVLLDRIAMPGEPGYVPDEGGPAGPRRRPRGVPDPPSRARGPADSSPAPTSCPPCRDDDPVGVRDGRVDELDLDPDDRVEADGLGGADEADRPVQPAVVRDGQPGQAQLDGPFHQVVRGRGAIEEREVRVAVEFGVRGRCHGSLRSGAGSIGGRSV